MDREWSAIDAIFNLPVFGGKRDVLYGYVDEARQTIDWLGLHAAIGSWSHGEQVLVRIAHALYNAEDTIPLTELSVLSPDLGQAVLTIIRQRYW